jgi:hypothetical protein
MLSFTYERPKARLRLLIKSVAPPRATSLGVPRALLEGRMRSLVARLVLAGVEEDALVCAPHVLGIRTPHGRHLYHHGSHTQSIRGRLTDRRSSWEARPSHFTVSTD